MRRYTAPELTTGVEAVTQAIRQLYEMIETDDERVQRLVASATAAHLQRIEQLSGRIYRLEEELASRVRQVHQLDLMVKELNKQLQEAREQTRLAREAHLATMMKNSQNSSLPPSTDRRKRTRSLREKSGRKPGGQVGHRGATREMVDVPDYLIIHAPESCSLCGSSLLDSEVGQSERRQTMTCRRQILKSLSIKRKRKSVRGVERRIKRSSRPGSTLPSNTGQEPEPSPLT